MLHFVTHLVMLLYGVRSCHFAVLQCAVMSGLYITVSLTVLACQCGTLELCTDRGLHAGWGIQSAVHRQWSLCRVGHTISSVDKDLIKCYCTPSRCYARCGNVGAAHLMAPSTVSLPRSLSMRDSVGSPSFLMSHHSTLPSVDTDMHSVPVLDCSQAKS